MINRKISVGLENLNPLSANPAKWPNTLKQFVGKLPTNWVCLAIFVKLALKGLSSPLKEIRTSFEGCVRFFFASLFCNSKREHLWNNKKCFLFHFKSSFRSWDNRILTFQNIQMLWRHQMPKHEHQAYFTE